MIRRTERGHSLFSLAALIVISILSSPALVWAQGWRTGEPKPAASSPSPSTPSAAASSSAVQPHAPVKTPKSPKARPASARAKSAAVHKAKTSGTTATTAAAKASRERLVNHNQDEAGSAANPTTAAKTPAVKSAKESAGSTRVAAATRARPGRCNPEDDERIDLSGAYTGSINYPNGGLTGEADLTITGNRFTLRTGSRTESGSITAVTTCTYTAVAMMFGEWRTPRPGERPAPPLPMLSLTATRKGDQLALKSSPSERREFLFAPAPKK